MLMEASTATLRLGSERSSTAIGVLRAVHAEPGITRARLARELDISSGLASETVARLVGSTVVAEGPARATGGRGRPTSSLGPHPRGPVAAVAAISHESWEVATVVLGGAVDTYQTQRHDRDRTSVLEGVEDALNGVCARYGARVRAIAVSLPGTVSGTRLVQAPNLAWHDVELSMLAPQTSASVPFLAGNDATFSAIADARRGAAAWPASLVHLYMDSGVGGAFLVGGQIVPGARGMAGEFGHMPFGSPAVRCRCGAYGCWNTVLDGPALARHLGESVPGDEVSYSRAVLAAARADDGSQRRAVRDAAFALGRGTAALVNALDPELVTFGGLAPQLLEIAGDRVRDGYHDGLMGARAEVAPALTPSGLGGRAPLIGAGEHAFDHILTERALAAWSAT
jgi:predicted NBD/HSP70 family sugar kinase